MRRYFAILVALCFLTATCDAQILGHARSATSGGGGGVLVGSPIRCAGAPASCSYTIIGTSNIVIACSLNAAGSENVLTPTETSPPGGLTNTWTALTAQQVSGVYTQRCWEMTPRATGSDAINLASQFGDVTYGGVFEFIGVTTGVDTSAFAGGSGATADSGAFVTTVTDTLIGFVFGAAANTPTAGTGWTSVGFATCSCNADARVLAEYQSHKSAASYHATANVTSGAWTAQGIGLKE